MSAFAAADEARASASLALRLAGHADAARALASIRVVDVESATRACSVVCDLERIALPQRLRDMLHSLGRALVCAVMVDRDGDSWVSRYCNRELALSCDRVANALHAEALRVALDAANREYAVMSGPV